MKIEQHRPIPLEYYTQKRLLARPSESGSHRTTYVPNTPPVSVVVGGAAFGTALKLAGSTFDCLQDSGLRKNFHRHLVRTVLSSSLPFVLSRSALFGIVSTTKESCLRLPWMSRGVPSLGGLTPAVVATGLTFGASVAVIDAVLATHLVRSGQAKVALAQLIHGSVMLSTFYISCDIAERKLPDPFSTSPFLRGGLCGAFAFAVASPFLSTSSSYQVSYALRFTALARSFVVLGTALQAFTWVESSIKRRCG
jgi:hypothetical protein